MAFISYVVGFNGQDIFVEKTFEDAVNTILKYHTVEIIDYLDEDNANLIVTDRENGKQYAMTIRKQEEYFDLFDQEI